MNILLCELVMAIETAKGVEHWIDVTYQTPILSEPVTVKQLMILSNPITEIEVLTSLIKQYRYPDLLEHSLFLYQLEKERVGNQAISL